MNFTVVKKGSRPSPASVYIAENSKTINFSVGFFRTFSIDLSHMKFMRLAFDNDASEIAIEFLEEEKNSDECLKLTFTESKKAASSSVNPILGTFSLDIKAIAGTYKDKAIRGPSKINGFTDRGFILEVKNRKSKKEKQIMFVFVKHIA